MENNIVTVRYEKPVTYVRVEYTSPQLPRIWLAAETTSLYGLLKKVVGLEMENLNSRTYSYYLGRNGLLTSQSTRPTTEMEDKPEKGSLVLH